MKPKQDTSYETPTGTAQSESGERPMRFLTFEWFDGMMSCEEAPEFVDTVLGIIY